MDTSPSKWTVIADPPRTPTKAIVFNAMGAPQTPPSPALPSIPPIPKGPNKRKREEPALHYLDVKVDWMLEYKGLMLKYHICLERR